MYNISSETRIIHTSAPGVNTTKHLINLILWEAIIDFDPVGQRQVIRAELFFYGSRSVVTEHEPLAYNPSRNHHHVRPTYLLENLHNGRAHFGECRGHSNKCGVDGLVAE